jgi:hypothetical protein
LAADDDAESEPTNRLLAAGGLILICMALLALVLDRGAPIEGGLAVLGTGLLVVSVLGPRMYGKTEFGLTGIKLNLAAQRRIRKAVVTAELEVARGRKLMTLDDITKDKDA